MGYLSYDIFQIKQTGQVITSSYFRLGSISTIERRLDGTYMAFGCFDRYYNNENVNEKEPLEKFQVFLLLESSEVNNIITAMYDKLKETYPGGTDC